MPLIKSISGIRGTIGGLAGESLTPIDIVQFASAYAHFIKERVGEAGEIKVVVGRDARISGEMVEMLLIGTLLSCGIEVIKAGLASTPTVEMAVLFEGAEGGIVITASHNPREWNALKLLNEKGEFLNGEEGAQIVQMASSGTFRYSPIDKIGTIQERDFSQQHIEAVLSHPLVEREKISKMGYKVVLDSVNSVGSIIMPPLLKRLGVEVIEINSEPNGQFAHNPEPLPHHLTQLSQRVVEEKATLGIAVDPDVDRLALICEDGSPFGEELTIVAAAQYLLNHKKGATVSNLSSSQALKEITEEAGERHYSSAVGEVNVVAEMKRVGAVIGGEGNGGVILPDLHYGRDALIATALILSHIADSKMTLKELRESLPNYTIVKEKIELSDGVDLKKLLLSIEESFSEERVTTIDGVKVDFERERKWVHIRASNTEPLLRIYAEAPTLAEAEALVQTVIDRIKIS